MNSHFSSSPYDKDQKTKNTAIVNVHKFKKNNSFNNILKQKEKKKAQSIQFHLVKLDNFNYFQLLVLTLKFKMLSGNAKKSNVKNMQFYQLLQN